MKNIILFFVFPFLSLFFAQRSEAQCYVRLEDASGFNTDPYQDSLQAAAAKLCAIFDTTGFAGQFKVYDFGYYLHHYPTLTGLETLWNDKKQQVAQTSYYYLLIAKETTPQASFSRFKVALNLPSTSPYDCIDQSKLETIEKQIELVINQKYQSLGASIFDYAEAEIAGIYKLKDILFKYTDCCLCCQNRQLNSCETCEYIDNSVAEECLTNNATLTAQVENFISEHGCSDEAKEFANYATKLICEEGDYKWERLEELYELIEENPNALLQSCSPPDPIYGGWENLASFVPSGIPLQRIQNSNGTWSVQSILDASGARVNLDFFAVVIDSLPIINGQRITAKQLFEHFRKNINDFAPKFSPYDDPYDTNLWASNNPLGTVMKIYIDFITDGDVIASQYEECCWIFTTLRGPFYSSGYHPVSGNRMWGYSIQNNHTIIYTRGADRTTTFLHGINDSQVAFEGADALWHGMQAKLSAYITENGGKLAAMPTFEIIHRPKWDEVKQILTSNYPITTVSCN